MKQPRIGPCLYCRQTKAFSREHVPNRSLGSFAGNRTLNDRICIDCNTGFKLIDEQFGRSSPEAFWRQQLGLMSADTPSPFSRGSAGASTMEMFVEDPYTSEVFRGEPDNQPLSVTPFSQLKVKLRDGSVRFIRISRHIETLEQLVGLLHENDILPEAISEVGLVMGRRDELERLQHLICELLPNHKSVEFFYPHEQQPQLARVHTRVMLTDAYFRSIAKMAFHYFLLHVPKYHGDEPAFDELRAFIQNGDRHPSFFVQPSDDRLLRGKPARFGHVFVAGRANDADLFAKVRFFDGPHNSPTTLVVRLGEDPTNLVYSEPYAAHYFEYYEGGARHGHDGQKIALTVKRRYIKLA